MTRLTRRVLLAAANLPFLLAARVILSNSLLGRPLFSDSAAIPLGVMGLGVTWVAALLLLRDVLTVQSEPPT
jgi:hypothetical protein